MAKPEFMYDNFEQYAEIMNITKDHPYWEAFQIVWRMARTPGWLLSDISNEEETSENN